MNTKLNSDKNKIIGAKNYKEKFILNDIFVCCQNHVLKFGNDKICLQFSMRNGVWLGLSIKGTSGSVITATKLSQTSDFFINGKWMLRAAKARLMRYFISIAPERKSVSLNFVFGVTGTNTKSSRLYNSNSGKYELTCEYKLFPFLSKLERKMVLLRFEHKPDTKDIGVRMEGFGFGLPLFSLGCISDCVLDVPGPWWPSTYIAPKTPYRKIIGRTLNLHSAPDGGFGFVALTNAKINKTVATWIDTKGETAYQPELSTVNNRLNLFCHDRRYYRLKSGCAVESDVQHIEISDSISNAQSSYRQQIDYTMPLSSETPSWVFEMIILEIYPKYFEDGLKGITRRIPFYKKIGFNTIYLMPHWEGGYSPIDDFKVDSSLGTAQDLKELVRVAHENGMKVLFDMVIHGFDEKSPYVKQKDMFCIDEKGEIIRHFCWKSLSTDWASRAYRNHMIDLVTHNLRQYDNDGYRVDANNFKNPNWDPALKYPAYMSGSSSVELLREILTHMRKIKPDSVLLTEVFGPLFHSVCNLVHDNQAEATIFFLEQLQKGRACAVDYKRHLIDIYSMLPRGANRVFYTRNHDTSWFYHFGGYTPQLLALDAVHTLFGIPEVFAGDPCREGKFGPSPDDSPGVWRYYRRLFKGRKKFSEFCGGDILLREVSQDNPNVIAGMRRKGQSAVLVVVSLSNTEQEVNLRFSLTDVLPFNTNNHSFKNNVVMIDLITGEQTTTKVSGGSCVQIRLRCRSFAVIVGKII